MQYQEKNTEKGDIKTLSKGHKFLLSSILGIVETQRIDDNKRNGNIFFKKLVIDGKLKNDTSLPPIFSTKSMFFENNREGLLEIKDKLENMTVSEGISLLKENNICRTDIYSERLHSFFIGDIKSIKEKCVSDIHAIIVGNGNRHMGMCPSYGTSREV